MAEADKDASAAGMLNRARDDILWLTERTAGLMIPARR
jgi:hypothetical protein